MVGGGHDSTSICHILLHQDAASKGPPCRRITTRVTRVKGYRTLQCECCGVLFPSGRGLENHRTVSRICYDSYHSSVSDRTSGIQRVTTSTFIRGLSSVSNSESNRQSQPHINPLPAQHPKG
eukprot:scaffold119545_cov24-Attheya_sp.AAC.1